MTLPRPVLIAILGLALCAAAFLATRSANDTGSTVTNAPVTPAPKHAKPAHKANAKHASKPGHDAAKTQPHAAAKPDHAAAAKPQVKPEPAKPAAPTSEAQKVLPAIKALGRGDVVVFFFTRRGAADDTGTAQAVKSISHQKGVSVFKAGFDDL